MADLVSKGCAFIAGERRGGLPARDEQTSNAVSTGRSILWESV